VLDCLGLRCSVNKYRLEVTIEKEFPFMLLFYLISKLA
jgi:hypothetical protein